MADADEPLVVILLLVRLLLVEPDIEAPTADWPLVVMTLYSMVLLLELDWRKMPRWVLELAVLLEMLLLELAERKMPSLLLEFVALFEMVLLLELETMRMPLPLELAVLFEMVLLELEEREIPLLNPLMTQFLTVTPVLPPIDTPIPEEPGPVILCPAQSKVILLAPTTMAVDGQTISESSVVSVVIVLLQAGVAANANAGIRNEMASTMEQAICKIEDE
jgi:hypothetical protein